ncbi:MAG TPA: T9SS type A sorting domain-containing protein, partial [Agriterribacter sp.]|nr:T9SS type A sorting domain-containing protein [Agriterribacter sp.]
PEAGSTFPNVSIGGRVLIALNGSLYFRGVLDNGLGEELYKLNEMILPVDWEDIGIECKKGLAHLYWKTAWEVNTKDFIVQASTDALTWTNRDTIAAAGSGSASAGYQFAEKSTRNKYRYYRLLQRDTDGKFTYSKLLNITCGNAETQLRVFPNPANSTITLSGLNARDITRIVITDITGRRVMAFEDKSTLIDISQLSKGLYILHLVKTDATRLSRKFIKQ